MAGTELSRAGAWLPASLLLHAALLAAALARGGEPAASGAAPAPRGSGELSVRLVAAPADLPPMRDPVPQQLPPPGAGPSQAAVAPTPPLSEADSADDSLYLAPDQLDRRARAVTAIDLPYPELAPPGHFSATLTLFIEDDGRVSRVRLEPDADAADGGSLPPVLEDSARQAFLASPFEPGELGGRAVRSRLRVEVQFRDD
jgi:hypothetical protein